MAHVFVLIEFGRRRVIRLQWLWSYLTYRRGARLITGGEGDR
jgi:NADH dehydrogenase